MPRIRAVLAAVLLVLAFSAATTPAAALHVCVTGPCDHGVVDDVLETHPLLIGLVCKITSGAWGANCWNGGGGGGGDPHS